MTAWHLVTGEYPPAPGGVSDYCGAVAEGLASAGDEVHVWCPAAGAATTDHPGVHVHAIAGAWMPADLRRIDAAIEGFPGERRLLVQWVPHAFGRRSLNVPFCRWIRRRARAGDVVDLMVHEPGLGFGEGGPRHQAAALIHRLMLTLLLGRARRVWVSIPAWTDGIRRWAFGRPDLSFCWLPVPSSIPVCVNDDDVRRARALVQQGSDEIVVGHFSTYSPATIATLRDVLPALLEAAPRVRCLLLGRGSQEALERLRAATPHHDRLHAAGSLGANELSCRLQACDLLLQPYPDGASTRRTTLMAALAHGLPVVTTVGRLSEPFWKHSDVVAVAPAGDAAALAQAVARLAAEPERRLRLGASARTVYDARFSLRNVITALRTDTCGVAG